jgi:polysaccharide export outer membrane protein
MKIIAYCLLLPLLILTSCTSKSKLTYLRQKTTDSTKFAVSIPQYKIKSGDNLSVEIKGLDPASIALFNMKLTASDPFNNASVFLSSFTVNHSGKITLPVIGNVKVSGVSLDSATAVIQDSVSKYFNQAFVYVKLTNFEISVIGEVNRPGSYTFYDNNITLLRALSTAGDLTNLGSRKRIKILRKSDQSVLVGDVNLNKTDFITSPYYYLNPGDIVYVEPTRLKSVEMNLAPWRTIFVAISGLALALKLFGAY